MPGAIVAIERIRFAIFVLVESSPHFAQADLKRKTVGQIGLRERPAVNRGDDRLAVLDFEREARVGLVANGHPPVIGNVKVQGAIAINVGHCQGHTCSLGVQHARLRRFSKVPFAIVKEDVRAAADRIDNQIQVTVAVDISERCAGRIQSGTCYASRFSDVLKFPVAQVAIQDVRSVQPTKKQITPSITVHVPRGNAGTIEINLVGE